MTPEFSVILEHIQAHNPALKATEIPYRRGRETAYLTHADPYYQLCIQLRETTLTLHKFDDATVLLDYPLPKGPVDPHDGHTSNDPWHHLTTQDITDPKSLDNLVQALP